MPAQPQTTLLEIVNTVARSVGHGQTADAAGSQDEAIGRLIFYANIAGMELSYMNPGGWASMLKPYSIDIIQDAPGQKEKGFALPPDYLAMLDETQWDASNQLPAIGPVNPQDWQSLSVRNGQILTRFVWRIRNGQLYVRNPPSVAAPFTFEYISKNWAVDVSTGSAKDNMSNNGDYHVYPWQLMMLYTRFKWFENEGYDSTGAQLDFVKALNYTIGTDKAAGTLSLVPGTPFPYIDPIRNLPDTGYGS